MSDGAEQYEQVTIKPTGSTNGGYGTVAGGVDSRISALSHRIDFTWKNIVYSNRANKDAPLKTILNNISGVVRSGKMCALMGSSGAGKTTLLDSLAGRVAGVQGEIQVNGAPITPAIRHKFTAYVVQQEKLSESFTVRETLLFHAIMKMPKDTSDEEHNRMVESLLVKLRLKKAQDTMIGGQFFRGISGGEKRRVSIGVELVTSPSVIFLDEPTSGLDSNSSFQVTRVLKELADTGRTIICSIHQPRPDIFFMMDHIMLISEGEVFFYGTPYACEDYFASIGYKCPEHMNLADYIIDVITPGTQIPGTDQDSLDINAIREYRKKFGETSFGLKMAEEVNTKSQHSSVFALSGTVDDDRISVIKQFKTLCWRTSVIMDRNPIEAKARLGGAAAQGLLGGIAFFDQSEGPVGARGRLGSIFFLCGGSSMASVNELTQVFPLERDLVMHERRSNTYSINAYFLSKMVMDRIPLLFIPFLFGGIMYPMVNLREGSSNFLKFWFALFLQYNAAQSLSLLISSIVPTVAAGTVYGPLVPIFFLLFSGFFVYLDDIPASIGYLSEVSLTRWSIQALSINEFDDREFGNGKDECDYETGDDVLEEFDYDDQSYGECLVMMTVMIFAFTLMLYISLVVRDRRNVV